MQTVLSAPPEVLKCVTVNFGKTPNSLALHTNEVLGINWQEVHFCVFFVERL